MDHEACGPRLGETVAGMLHTLGDVVFPPRCVNCGDLVEHAGGFRHLCGRCANLVVWVNPPNCRICGYPFFGILEGERVCPHCDGLNPVFAEGRTATLFKGPVRSLVIELKYHRGLHVLHDIEVILTRSPHILNFVRGASLVPVPLHPRKRRERGYNQTELLAEVIARAAGGGTRCADILVRVVDTETQTAFDRRARMRNLKNAFALAPGAALNPASFYILVDDVFTTGSTLNSCAHVLRDAGALNLGVVTLGHG